MKFVQLLGVSSIRGGSRKLRHLLQEPLQRQAIALGRDAMFDVLRNARLLVAPRRAYHMKRAAIFELPEAR